MSNRRDLHWHRDPAPSTINFAREARFTPTGKGLQTAIEVIAYPEGKVQVAVSQISGTPGKRSISQLESLMFNDMNEAKDAVDLILDQLTEDAAQPNAS